MVAKPTADDVWTLAALPAVIAVATALVVRSLRTPATVPARQPG